MILLSRLQNWIPCHILKIPLLSTSVCNNADILSVRNVLTSEVQERITQDTKIRSLKSSEIIEKEENFLVLHLQNAISIKHHFLRA